ncbi:MBL fold metallo-hydrolase [Brevibacterium limosum]|uniref:MBL fold metallo-hydrolase n=1 Tax=Brevibacterium limosum TaxID=2697565 RepID=UPI001422F910|nr:MBL fold metallo-hydrolase [Brevibacterium limosum]
MAVTVSPLFSPWGRFGLYSFFIDAEEPAIVDAGVTSTVDGTVAELEKSGRRIEDVRWILLTHGHIDHLGGAYALWELTGRKAKVVIHEADLDYLRRRRAHVENYLELRDHYLDNPEAESQQTGMAEAAISGEMSADVVLRGGESLSLGGGVSVSAHSIPGHTAGSVAYVIDGQNDVFVGDAVQIHGAANGFPGYEDPNAYRSSLECLRDVVRPNRLFLGHPYRNSAGEPYDIGLDAAGAAQAFEESLAIEARIREAVGEGFAETSSPYSPFEAVATEIGYSGDPSLEPSPFFTTMDGYRRLFDGESEGGR